MAEIATTCCIAGGGPAGMMLGFLLARAGVEVVVLEKHADFLRDFRGDTIHPSTLELMHELGLVDEFLRLPHQEVRELAVSIGGKSMPIADFTHLPTHCRFLALMPQWDFLDFLAKHGARYPTFRLVMQAKVTGLIEDGGRIAGVEAETPEGPLRVRAPLVVAADGRSSDVRRLAALGIRDIGAPMDVLWFRLSRRPDDPGQTGGYVQAGRVFVMLDRGDYWQCAFVIAKGSIDALRTRGLDSVREEITALAPFLRDRVGELADWDQLKLLTVAVDRMPRWHHPGLLCIGDAAHAMSPIGGVGVNLAVQDAVAAANILAEPLRRGVVDEALLVRVQRRREWPTRVTQAIQVVVQKRLIARVLTSTQAIAPPFMLRLFGRLPLLRRLPARVVGLGVRPEHIRTPDAFASARP